MLEKNGMFPVTMAEIKEIRKGKVPKRLLDPPWELNLHQATEMLDEFLGVVDDAERSPPEPMD